MKQGLKNCANVVGSGLIAAVPVVGLGVFGMGQMFNDSDQGLQGLTMLSHVAGVGSLIAGAVTGDHTLLATGVAGLGVAAVAAGAVEARRNSGGWTTPFIESTTYNYPKG